MPEAIPPQDPTQPGSPLLDLVKRVIAAHPILKDEKKLVVHMKGHRVEVTGTVFTQDMHRQLVAVLDRIPGAAEILFTCEPQIKAPERRTLEGRVPGVSPGPLPSDPFYSVRRKRSN